MLHLDVARVSIRPGGISYMVIPIWYFISSLALDKSCFLAKKMYVFLPVGFYYVEYDSILC